MVRELNYLIQNWGTLNAAVMQDDSSSDLISARAQYLKEGNYKSAYSYELHYIPQLLSQVLNKNESIDLRVKNFDLLHQIPLFRELGSALIMRLIPIAKLKESVSLELQVSGRKIKTVDNVYPKNSDLKESHLFNQVVEENAFATNRSFNLRQYMNEDGSSMTLKQLTDRIQ